ncbi:MAG: AsmA family protein [Sphingobacteriales bacterium]|nr:MAG: AsmA family protein [Sphingobacteriales bacterium]
MIKKILKIVLILLVLIVASLFAIPYFFKSQIKDKIAETINQKINATASFADADLSLFKNFPNANITIKQLLIINKAPFVGDTLVSLGELNLKMSIKQLFKTENEALQLDGIDAQNGAINILFNKEGKGNFDILIKDTTISKTAGKPLALKIKQYSVANFRFKYYDESSKIKFVLDSLNHSGTGDFAASKLDLTTKTNTLVSLTMDKTTYMNKLKMALDAVLAINLDSSKYTFKNNQALINQLPLHFDGFIQLKPEGQQYDLTFKTPTSSFQNFLALIPAAYSGSLKDVKTTGDFSVNGFAKGLYTKTTVPKFNIAIASNNASFKYTNLPKTVQNIIVDTKIINESGKVNDTYVNLNKLSFKIDKDVFDAKANVKNIITNPLVNAVLKGTINLANLAKAYPIKLDKNLSGILNANVTTNFDMNSVKTNKYQNIKNAGTISLAGFKYVDEKGKALNIANAAITFNPSHINLQQFKATTGKTDLNVTGSLDNFYGFLFNKQELKGNFNLTSNQFAVADFISSQTDTTTKSAPSKEAIKIPAFLNCTLNAKANTVLYDNLVLKNVSGKMLIRDQKVSLQNIKTSIFDGVITVNGDVSTKEKTPVFNMDLGLDKVDIPQTFAQLEMFKKIAPFAGMINGKLNSTIKLAGNLDAKEFTPDLKTLKGDLLGQLLTASINSNNSNVVNTLASNLKFIDVQKLNLNDLKGTLTFENGKVNVKPIDLKYQDIKMQIGGTHGFDQVMNYNIKLDVPAKYLGTQANALMAKLTPADVAKLENIPVNATLGGTFSKPTISTDLKSAATNLATQLVKQQKEKLISKGTAALGNFLDKALKKDTSSKTNSVKDDVKQKAGSLLKGLFGK